ncbi:MAG: tetratricopeptide repeat protein [Ignavibacteria bacterium]|nr:tetratricopeptide repeat protein [Ignavibacteria bacterium]
MERCKFYLIVFILLIYSEVSAQIYPDAVVDSLLRTGIQYVVNQDYTSANKIFTRINKEYSNLPLGKIYLAANKIAEAYDYAEDFDETYIRENLESAKNQSEKLLDSDESNIWYRYFYALSEGYLSYFEAINGNWFSALTTGINSISEFEKILSSEENFFEAYIAIGTFEYWKSRKLELVSWLPFSNDTKNIGIDILIIAIDSSSYNSHLAVNSLIWIYIDQKKYEEAISVAQNALKEFPESRTFKWGMARAYEETTPLKAIKLYKDILNSYPEIKTGNYKNEITLKHIIAQQYARLGNREEAIKYCDEILSMKNISKKTLEEMSNRLERVNELKKELTLKN